MSYQIQSRTYPIGPGYYREPQTYPLSYGMRGMGQLAPAPPVATGIGGAGITVQQIVIGVVVVIIAIVALWYMTKAAKAGRKVERNAVVQRISTKELAQRLFERLEKRGYTNKDTLRSLDRLAR